jgi:hypothetical protein
VDLCDAGAPAWHVRLTPIGFLYIIFRIAVRIGVNPPTFKLYIAIVFSELTKFKPREALDKISAKHAIYTFLGAFLLFGESL